MNIKEPMDVYSSRMDIPFEMAAYARGHKFAVEVVELARALHHVANKEAGVKAAEDDLADAMARLAAAKDGMKRKMNRDPA